MRFRVLLFAVLAPICARAQAGRQYTAADYDRAVKMLTQNLGGLTVGGNVAPNWLPDGRFWYRGATQNVVINPSSHGRVACDTTATTCDGATLTGGGRGGRGGGRGAGGRGGGRGGGAAGNGVMSPDSSKIAFIKDWNLYVRDVATGQEKQLTTDGVKDDGYATDNAGWAGSDRPILLWSPDSKKIATQQQDERNVGDMYLVRTQVGHPTLMAWKYPLPGDSVVAMIRRVIIDAQTGTVTALQMPLDFHRSLSGDNLSMSDLQWSPDATQLAVASATRDHKTATLRIANAATGAVRTVLTETEKTHYESHTGWRVLWGSNEVIWYSQRDNWGQLYLYDLTSGALRNKITTGEGPVTSIARVDEGTRTIWYGANGREQGQDPYFTHFYKIGFDGKGVVSLTPENGTHTITLSPDAHYVVDRYSRPDAAPVVELRDGATGKLVMPLEKADISKLTAAGWKPPIPIKVKAADGATDLYGLMFVPTNLDRTRKYPIINNAYPGPQTGSTGSRAFTEARGDRQALAELGFIVVTIDGRGTPDRSKSFHDYYYGSMGRDNTLPDQVAGMKDLARQYSFIDIDRAAMWGHSGGGFITADAMFRYPDFFKVGIAESGNHDQREYEDDWGERYQGLLTKNADGTDNYDVEANQNFAKNLKGHLMLAHGTMDNNVPPYNTLLVVDALIRANKDFDLVLIPNQPHGYGGVTGTYMMRRRWDYFVRYLAGAAPPKEYEIQAGNGGRGGAGGRGRGGNF